MRFTDRAGNYQYRAFGVPGLGLKRGLADDLVVAPYATALAAQVDPVGGRREPQAARGSRPRWPIRLLRGARLPSAHRATSIRNPTPRPAPAVVRAYFAHHQGMSLVAFANVICDDAFVARFHADPRVQASELLLQERVPREAILSEPRPDDDGESATAVSSLRSTRPGDSGRRTPPALIRSSSRMADTRPP